MHKSFKFELKDIGEKGSFTGMASVYGNVDLGDDVVEPGAFTKTIQDKGGEVAILWQHDQSEPVGMGEVKDSSQGLQIKGQLVMDSPVAQKAHALMKAGVIKGLSIGYDVVKKEIKDNVRYLKELKLWEVSLVTFPMNPMAMVSGVKADDLESKISALESKVQELQALAVKEAAKALPETQAATHQEATPDALHLALDRISQILEGAA